MIKVFITKVFLTFFIVFLYSFSSLGFQVSIPENTIYLNDSLVKTISIRNPKSVPAAVQVSARHRSYDIKGVESYFEESDDLLLIPPQFVIPPQEEEVVTVRWVGDMNLTKELPFRIVVEDIPIPSKVVKDQGEFNGSINFNFQFVQSFYVSPPNLRSYVSIIDQQIIKENGIAMLRLELMNSGKKHQIIREMTIQFNETNKKTSKNKVTLDQDILGVGINLLPGAKRFIDFKIPVFLQNKNLRFIETKLIAYSDE